MTAPVVDCCVTDLGQGLWTAYLLDRASGIELPLEADGWRGTAGRVISAVSEASIVLDPTYARVLARRPVLWQNELVLRRNDRLEWVGPITSIDDDDETGVVWNAQDRMVWVAERRPFWRTASYTGESTRLFSRMLDSADFGDPVGLIRDPRPNGVVSTVRVTAGDKTGEVLSTLGRSMEWTVIGDVVRYGKVGVNAERTLPADSWGDDRPALVADGFERLSHVIAVTENRGRVFYPSANPNDRPPGSPLLVDTVDVGDVDIGTAARVARNLYESRQGELAIVPTANRPASAAFPLEFTELVPGATMSSTVQGAALFADGAPVRLEAVSFEISDGVESSVSPALSESPGFDPLEAAVFELDEIGGLIFPPDGIFPASQDFDWGDFGFDLGDLGGLDLSSFGADSFDLDGFTGPFGDIDGFNLDNLSSFGAGDLGGLAGPTPGFDPIEMDFGVGLDDFELGLDEFGLDPAFEDPYASCPSSDCCDFCGGGGGGGGGGFGGTGFRAATAKDHTDGEVGYEYVLAAPPGYQPGDLLLANIVGGDTFGGAPATLAPPDGWDVVNYVEQDTIERAVWTRFADGADSFEFTASPFAASQTAAFPGIAATSGFDSNQETGTTGTFPQVTTTVPGSIIVYGYQGSAGDANPPPVVDGLSILATQEVDAYNGLYMEVQPVAGESTARPIEWIDARARTLWSLILEPAESSAGGGVGGDPSVYDYGTIGGTTSNAWALDSSSGDALLYGLGDDGRSRGGGAAADRPATQPFYIPAVDGTETRGR